MKARKQITAGAAVCGAVFMFLFVILLAAHAADEITATAKLKVENGYFEGERVINNVDFDQGASGSDWHIQQIGTNSEAITVVSDVSSNGWALFRMLSTNSGEYVDVSLTLRLRPGYFFLGPLHPTNAINAQASTNGMNLDVWINNQ